ncbi:D-xylose 1-dehydrogenase Gfo6 [Natronobiforma cellulositropha]|uniref:D-xylose 1-dehydrogenase Gfo6 n=1 Tax=Natronobiforma cellulositropha TaxID=1679076 RepID=UPI0021D5E154|nr:D-xylose 1-dehydrogenase Gfo6 [Natronobiforma cellulositropha]
MMLDVPTRFDERDWERDVDGGPVRFAVVGLGWFGRDVAIPAIEESRFCETTTLVSGSPETAASVADEVGVETVLTYDEYAAGESADAYDAVYVVTPNALHLPHVETAAALGKHVLCEKPLEADGDRAAQAAAVCEEAGVTLMTAYRMQTTRSVRWVRERIREGFIGEPVQLHGEFSFRMLAGEDADPTQWRIDPDLAGGGALMDIGVYPLNTARFLLESDPVAVRATTSAPSPAFDGVDEHVAFTLEFPDGVTASCTASFGAASANRLAILGTEGRIVIEPIFGVDVTRTITLERDGGRTVVETDEPHEVCEEFDYFATAILADGELEAGGDHGVLDVRITDAIYESADRGERIEL